MQVDVDLPPDLALAKAAPPVRALVTGPGHELIKLYASPPVLRATIPSGAVPPIWRLSVSPSDVQVSRAARVNIQDIEPRTLTFDLDRVARRDVPVALRGTLEAESGFAIGKPLIVTPSIVRISGPRSLVAAIDSFPTEAVEIRGVTGPFERTVTLDTASHPLIRVAPREVTVSGRTRRS
ncbi:MAG TPA: YbbR-like domain-containing protein [Gemmatimonadales bacterium]